MIYYTVFIANIIVSAYFLIIADFSDIFNLVLPTLLLTSSVLGMKVYLAESNTKERLAVCVNLLNEIGKNVLYISENGQLKKFDGWKKLINNINHMAAQLQHFGHVEIKSQKIHIKKKEKY